MYFSISSSAPSTSYSIASPMEIPSSATRSTSTATCAYPSWPRRSSLSSPSSASEEYPNRSFVISDEELFGLDVFEDELSPVSSPSSNYSRSPASPAVQEPRFVVESGSLFRSVVAEEKQRRERKKRSASTSSKKSTSGSQSKKMSPIVE